MSHGVLFSVGVLQIVQVNLLFDHRRSPSCCCTESKQADDYRHPWSAQISGFQASTHLSSAKHNQRGKLNQNHFALPPVWCGCLRVCCRVLSWACPLCADAQVRNMVAQHKSEESCTKLCVSKLKSQYCSFRRANFPRLIETDTFPRELTVVQTFLHIYFTLGFAKMFFCTAPATFAKHAC